MLNSYKDEQIGFSSAIDQRVMTNGKQWNAGAGKAQLEKVH